MIKKIIIITLASLSIFLLAACEEITGEFETAQKPSITLTNTGELIQIYDENATLEDVTFTLVLKQFTENNISDAQITINWYVREQLMSESKNARTYTQVVKSPGEIDIRVEVLFTFEGKAQKLEASSLINVVRTPTSILVTNSVDETTHRVSATLGESNTLVFTGRITGNVTHEHINWVIMRQTIGEPELVEMINAQITMDNAVAKSILTYEFLVAGNYIVTLQTGEGLSQDANKYISNSTHINVGYGAFDLLLDGQKVQSDGNTNSRTLTINPLNEALVGEGTYAWYLNGNSLDHDELTYEHTNTDLGGYLYEVMFVPSNNDPIIKTEPLLLVNGLEVGTEAELLLALEEKALGIILTEDIHYTSEAGSLNINYPVTIYGDGHTLSSNEISVFISVTSDQVYMSNLKIIRANRYNLMFTRVHQIYLEDLVLDEIGGGSDASAFLSGDFGSGIYVNQSEVVINNVEFLSGGLVGIRIDNDGSGTAQLAKLEVLGKFKFNLEDPLFLPIGSGKSEALGIEVIANGFDYFALPAGNIVIRRWDNQGDPVTWELYEPEMTVYEPGAYLDLFGVGIFVDISFLNLEISGANGLDFVKMYIALFKQYGKVEITNLDDEEITTYYIIGEATDTVYGEDRLAYSLDKLLLNDPTSPGIQVKPVLPSEPGEYKVKVYIGEEFYLGHIIITVK